MPLDLLYAHRFIRKRHPLPTPAAGHKEAASALEHGDLLYAHHFLSKRAPLPRQAAEEPARQLVRYGDRFGSIRRLIRSLGRLIAQERRYYRSYRRLAALNDGKLAHIGRTRGGLPAAGSHCAKCA